MAMSTRRSTDGGVVFLMDTADGYLRVEATPDGSVTKCEVRVNEPGAPTSPASPRRTGCCGEQATMPRTPSEAERDLAEGLH